MFVCVNKSSRGINETKSKLNSQIFFIQKIYTMLLEEYNIMAHVLKNFILCNLLGFTSNLILQDILFGYLYATAHCAFANKSQKRKTRKNKK